MKRSMAVPGFASVIAGAALALPVMSFAGGDVQINVADDDFSPDDVSRSVDDGLVRWVWDFENNIHDHNVVQDTRLFTSGPPSLADDPFEISPSAGTFPYYCTVHGAKGGVGMSGVVRVSPDLAFAKRAGGEEFFGIAWASGSTNTGNQYDVQYKVDDGRWKDWKKNSSATQGLFGKNGKPVTLKAGKVYRVRARSEKASNPKKRSKWSPAVMFQVGT